MQECHISPRVQVGVERLS